MKLDVLDGFKTIKICTSYEVNGEIIKYMPSDLENVKPVYEEIAGWDSVVGCENLINYQKMQKNI